MLETPIDVSHVWLALAMVSVVLAGLALGLPSKTPPDAASAATVVDRIAANPHPATVRHQVDATAVRIGPQRIGLRNDRGVSHASFAFGPITPAVLDPLRAVLHGKAPERAFESAAEFRRAAARARNRTPTWRTVADKIVVRSVSWEGVDVTLVGS